MASSEFFIDVIRSAHYGPGVDSASKRNEYQEYFLGVKRPVRRADKLNTFMCRLSWNLGASAFWNPQGLSRPVMGLLYLYSTAGAWSVKYSTLTSVTQYQTGMVRRTYHWGEFVCKPLLQWKSKEYYICWVCICSLRYPACNAHAPYCHLCLVGFYSIFSTLSHKEYDFKKKILKIKYVFWFSLQLPSTTFVILTRTERDIGFHVKCPLFLPDFDENSIFSTEDLKNTLNIKFYPNPSNENQLSHADGAINMTKLTVAFNNFANWPKT